MPLGSPFYELLAHGGEVECTGSSGLANDTPSSTAPGLKSSPDHEYHLQNKERIGANRAALSIARKLIRRAHHTIRELGEEAISEPVLTSESA
jgi:hypothetical protein